MHRKQIGQGVEESEAQGAIYPDRRLTHGEFLLVKGPRRCIQPPMSSRRYNELWMRFLECTGMYLSRSDLLPSKLPGTWDSIPKFGIQSLDSGYNPYASWTRTWPPNQVPLTCKPPGLRNTCLGHTIQLLINSGFIPESSKHSTHQSLHFLNFLCNPDFPTFGVPRVLITRDAKLPR